MSLVERLKAMPPELRNAGIAAAALVASMILPWYQKSYVPPGAHQFTQANLSAFGVFSFIEAAVLVVAAGVLFLVWARTNRRAFHLPGGDGAVITAAGAWALVLLVWRLFDKPDIKGIGVTVGIQWGIFGALLAAGALVAAGARVRAAHRPEPPNPVAEEEGWVAPDRPRREPRGDRRPRDSSAVTDVLRDPPRWEGEAGEPPKRARPSVPDDAETRRFRDDDAETRRIADPGDERTRRLPPDEPSGRLWEDE
jgi:hypothetical protein